MLGPLVVQSIEFLEDAQGLRQSEILSKLIPSILFTADLQLELLLYLIKPVLL